LPETIEFTLNGATQRVDEDPTTPLLWILRDTLGLTGTKFGCGQGLCGACTVSFEGVALRSCQIPLSAVQGKNIITIEGVSSDDPLQRAWVETNVVQCGYCQPGQIMSARSLLETHPHPSDEEIDLAMQGNICRCGTYPRIRRAIHHAAQLKIEQTQMPTPTSVPTPVPVSPPTEGEDS